MGHWRHLHPNGGNSWVANPQFAAPFPISSSPLTFHPQLPARAQVVLDEAQLVANSSSVAAVMASSLWRRHAWVCTGTPITAR